MFNERMRDRSVISFPQQTNLLITNTVCIISVLFLHKEYVKSVSPVTMHFYFKPGLFAFHSHNDYQNVNCVKNTN